MKKHYGHKKLGDKSCQSNFDKRLSDFGSFLVIQLLLYHGTCGCHYFDCYTYFINAMQKQICNYILSSYKSTKITRKSKDN